ncbi:Calreticulin-domain-containing protein [Suhomyces tanzawaensis NRRL Y-17324]|uniref:Calreticulin-domain-containing protein n=1 Tax=Suhomyces tanzawaensis NRRL Y-17324 TaxID=984487 RepID=A0A1E4SHN6_9ASCO|nr:Calreticulin-domain-containing protein [Suhomyces tanzawaensis NRRL Y-17324]ODV79006.1 Calreticulin-domain-containing protein [Suhomyces tanzawaensis NRRL Y-17324]
MLKCLVVLALFVQAFGLEIPEYAPYQKHLTSGAIFDQFDYDSLKSSPWVPSSATKFDEGRREVVAYNGEWGIETSKKVKGYANDRGLVMKSQAAHYAIARKLDEPFDNTGNDLVFQYEIKLENDLSCGGTYVKLLSLQADYLKFNSDTPYQVMFGPDKCGSQNMVHFIIKRVNPHTGVAEEKHLRTAPMSKGGVLSSLYTLIIKKNQDFEIRINGEVAKAGNLVTSTSLLRPPLNPPREIEDPNDKKPFGWDERLTIPDPNAEKPDNYELNHVWTQIPDVRAEKPEDWDESKPKLVRAEDSQVPDYWDEEEDGEWIAPLVPNPECENISGCGPWEPPLVDNPHYIGPWASPRIDNPDYQGEWKPRTIPNPEYYNDERPSDLEPIGAIAFELWSMDSNVMFDNVYLGHLIKEAEQIGNETWRPKYELEHVYREANRPKLRNEPVPPPPDFQDLLFADPEESTLSQFLNFIRMASKRQYLEFSDFIFEFVMDPVPTVLESPVRFVIYCSISVVVLSVIFGTWAVLMFVLFNKSEEPSLQEEKPETEVQYVPKIEELSDHEIETVTASESTSSAVHQENNTTKRK